MDEISKSQRKRDVEALQALGVKLTRLPQAQLDQLPLPDDLITAINEYKKIKSREALRRQAQYLGRVMREIDVEPILDALKRFESQRY